MEFREIQKIMWSGDIEKFKSVLNEDLDYYVNLEDSSKRTILNHAAGVGRIDFIKFLVESGADINHKDVNDYTPILSSLNNNDLNVFKYFFNLNADIDIRPNYRSPGLVGEASKVPKLHELLKKVIDKSNSIDHHDLSIILDEKAIKVYKYILDNKKVSSMHIIDSVDSFFYGENNKAIEFLEYLLDNNFIDINEKSSDGESLIEIVSRSSGNIKVIKYLLEKEVDIHSGNIGRNCLFAMATENDFQGIKLFLNKGIDINLVSSNKRNVLHVEASRYLDDYSPKETEIPKVFKFLVDKKVDISLVDRSNKLALHYLKEKKRDASIKYIYENTIKAILSKDISDEEKFNVLFSIQEIPTNKKEKDFLINAFCNFPQFSSKFHEQLYEDKLKLREMAIKTLIKVDKEENLEALQDRSETESNKNLLKALSKYLESKYLESK